MGKQALFAVTLLILGGCSVTPYKVPLSPVNRPTAEAAEVHARTGKDGIGVQYFAQDSSAAGAGYGLIGALVTATIDAIANADPADIAQDAADKLTAAYRQDDLHSELALALSVELGAWTSADAAPVITKMKPEQKLVPAALPADNVLAVELSYSLTPDWRALQVVGTATLLSKTVPAGKSSPKGVIYRNRFEYCSAVLAPAPMQSPDSARADADYLVQ